MNQKEICKRSGRNPKMEIQKKYERNPVLFEKQGWRPVRREVCNKTMGAF